MSAPIVTEVSAGASATTAEADQHERDRAEREPDANGR